MWKVRNKIHTSRTKYVHREKGKRENHKKWSNTVHISGKSLDNGKQGKVQQIEFFTEAMQAVELCLHSLYVVIIADSICSYCTSSATTVRYWVVPVMMQRFLPRYMMPRRDMTLMWSRAFIIWTCNDSKQRVRRSTHGSGLLSWDRGHRGQAGRHKRRASQYLFITICLHLQPATRPTACLTSSQTLVAVCHVECVAQYPQAYVCPSASLHICLSACMSTYLYIHLSTWSPSAKLAVMYRDHFCAQNLSKSSWSKLKQWKLSNR